MKTYTISASWGESWTFHADDSDLWKFGFSIEEAVYVAWEMEPVKRTSYWLLGQRLLNGEPVVFSYHGVNFATLQLKGNKFSLVE
jgi:hypothetical protein